MHLDGEVGFALAKILLLFGISPASHEGMIADWIHRLLQGWAVKIPQDEHESLQQSFAAFYFVFTDGVYRDPRTISRPTMEKDIRNAFENGVVRAATELLQERSSRPNKRLRQKNKEFIRRHQNA
jgi:hypothetical protein